jgi:hypothetical protein
VTSSRSLRAFQKTGSIFLRQHGHPNAAGRWARRSGDQAEGDATASSMFAQLTWLKEAGCTAADYFWLQAGHAIMVAITGAPRRPRIAFAAALGAVHAVLQATSPVG